MSMHQYIGARYVPYYYENSLDPTSTEWEPNVSYEALTVVTLPNQHSYISKKFVPDTVGSPALNAEYWKDTGYDNAYIQALQEQIDELTVTVGANNAEVHKLVAPQLDQRNANYKVMFVTDSYGNQIDNDGQRYTDLVAQMLGITVGRIASSGSSVRGGSLREAVNAYTGDTDFDKVVILTGANDQTESDVEVGIINAMVSLVNAIRTKFNPSEVIVMCPGLTFSSTYSTLSRIRLANSFRKGAIAAKAKYIENSQYILCDTRKLQNDMCHPNHDGIHALAENVCHALLTGVNDISYATNITAESGRLFYMRRHNGVTIVNIREAGATELSKSSGTGNGTATAFENLPNSLVEVSGSLGADNNNLFGYCTANGSEERAMGSAYISDKQIKGYVFTKSYGAYTNLRLIGNLIFND